MKKPLHINGESLNPKEKARIKAQMDHIASLSNDDKAMTNVARSYAQQDEMRLRRCRSAMARKMIPVIIHDRILHYHPATGDILWVKHPSHEKHGHEATVKRLKDDVRVLYTPDGKMIPAARIAHAAVHGPIPEEHEVYCVNNDPTDLRITNLRIKPKKASYLLAMDRLNQRPSNISDEDRENIRRAREEVARSRNAGSPPLPSSSKG